MSSGNSSRYYGLAASSTSTLIDGSTYDALINHKQKEIIRLVAEGNENSELVRQKQGELDVLVNAKKNEQGKGKSGGAAYSNAARNKLKEFRRALFS